jgi:hypothetical protein
MKSLGYSHETPKQQWEPSFTGKYTKEEKHEEINFGSSSGGNATRRSGHTSFCR